MGRILVPNKDIIYPSNRIEMPTARMGGFVRCQIHKGKSGTLKHDTGWFHNIITDAGIGYFAHAPSGGAYGGQIAIFGQCAVGTGSGTPTVNDSSLFSYLTSYDTGWNNSTSSGYTPAASPTPAYWYNINTYTFPTGAAAGNLTEVGIYPDGVTYGAGLFSHALILDASGNPTSITVLSDEVLTVTYQTNFYIDTADHTFSFPLNGTTNNGLYRATDISATPVMNGNFAGWGSYGNNQPSIQFWTGDIQGVTAAPSGSAVFSKNSSGSGNQSAFSLTDIVNDMANSGTWYYDVSITFPTGTAATLLAISYEHCFIKYQYGNLTTPITKTTGQQLQASFRASWGRYP